MKQITEDYCNKEISVLLREKGFDVPVKNYFSLNKDAILHNLDKQFGAKKNWNHFEYCISRPSQSLALKWLREVYNLHIEIYRTACGYLYIISNIPYGTDLYNPEYGGDDENSGQWTTYEKCVEAALKYTLENLI